MADVNVIGLEQELVNPLAGVNGDKFPNGFWKIQEYRNLVGTEEIEVLLNSYVNYDALLESCGRVSGHKSNIIISDEYTITSQPDVLNIIYSALIAQDVFFVDATIFDTDDHDLHVADTEVVDPPE